MKGFYRPPAGRQVRPTRRRPARRALRPALVTLVLATGALAGVLVLKHDARFAVRRVVLEGVPEARRAETEEVTDALLGRPLFLVNLDGVVSDLSRRPWVARAAARRVVPDTLVVRVEVRPPVALARHGTELWTVDRSGVWLGPYAGRTVAPEDDFPLLDGPGDEESLRRGMAFLMALKAEDADLFSRVSEVSVTAAGALVTDRGARARLLLPGDPAAAPRAAAAWRAWLALVPELMRRGLPGDAADLRFEGRIFVKAPPDVLGRGNT